MIRLVEVYKIVEASQSYSALSKDGEDIDDYHQDIIDAEFSKIKKTWDRSFDGEVKSELRNQLQRIVEDMKSSSVSGKIRDSKVDGNLKLMKLNPESIVQRGDYRYDSSHMADTLIKSNKDLVPISVGAKSENGPYWVLDGHHRLRAYKEAGRDVLSFVLWPSPKKKEQPMIHFNL